MGNSNLKMLAKKAKDRLKEVSLLNSQTQNKPAKSMALANHEFAIIATRVKIEDDPLYSKIEKMLEKDPDTSNPIGQLIDHKVYDTLSEPAKQKYILNLATRFNKIKQKLAI